MLFRNCLHVKPEQDHIAVLHHIILAFAADEALFLCRGHGAIGNQILIGDDFCADKAALKVLVNFACGLRGFGAAPDRPCTHLRLAGGEIGNEAEQVVGALDEPVEAAFFEP